MVNDISPLPPGKKVYFVSDLHLGSPDYDESLKREKLMVKWLDEISADVHTLIFLGDIFDFWFEYKHVVPKGFLRFLGKISQLREQGIKIYFFAGNHDMWMSDYFPKELDIPIVYDPVSIKINNFTFYIAHGDGLGEGDSGYKALKRIFRNPVCQWLFARIHPNLGFRIANYWSRKSRMAGEKEIPREKDRLIQFCLAKEEKEHHDYYIFGHRHRPDTFSLNENSAYINLGDWIDSFTYGVFNSDKVELKSFDNIK